MEEQNLLDWLCEHELISYWQIDRNNTQLRSYVTLKNGRKIGHCVDLQTCDIKQATLIIIDMVSQSIEEVYR